MREAGRLAKKLKMQTKLERDIVCHSALLSWELDRNGLIHSQVKYALIEGTFQSSLAHCPTWGPHFSEPQNKRGRSPQQVNKGKGSAEVLIKQQTQLIKPWKTNNPFDLVNKQIYHRSALSLLSHTRRSLLPLRNIYISIAVCQIHLWVIERIPDMSFVQPNVVL